MQSRDELIMALQAAVFTGIQIGRNEVRRAFRQLERDTQTQDEFLREMSAMAIQHAVAAQRRAELAGASSFRANRRAEAVRAKCMFLPPDWPSCDEMS